MCLTAVDRAEENVPETIGYKVMNLTNKGYEPLYITNVPVFQKNGKWVEACNSDKLVILPNGKNYDAGFHLFKTKEAALKYVEECLINSAFVSNPVILKVKYKGHVTHGAQEGIPCIVAQYIKLPKQKIGYIILTCNAAPPKNVWLSGIERPFLVFKTEEEARKHALSFSSVVRVEYKVKDTNKNPIRVRHVKCV